MSVQIKNNENFIFVLFIFFFCSLYHFKKRPPFYGGYGIGGYGFGGGLGGGLGGLGGLSGLGGFGGFGGGLAGGLGFLGKRWWWL